MRMGTLQRRGMGSWLSDQFSSPQAVVGNLVSGGFQAVAQGAAQVTGGDVNVNDSPVFRSIIRPAADTLGETFLYGQPVGTYLSATGNALAGGAPMPGSYIPATAIFQLGAGGNAPGYAPALHPGTAPVGLGAYGPLQQPLSPLMLLGIGIAATWILSK